MTKILSFKVVMLVLIFSGITSSSYSSDVLISQYSLTLSSLIRLINSDRQCFEKAVLLTRFHSQYSLYFLHRYFDIGFSVYHWNSEP